MRLNIPALLVAAVLLVPRPALAAVTVTIANGTVSVSAQDATVRQILTEWARVGQTRIVNIERIAGPPVSIELTNVPESQALDTLLRAVSGYLAAPRAVAVPNASAYDRIFILPTSTGTPPRPGPGPAAAGPGFAAPPFPAAQDDQNSDDEPPPPQRPSPPIPQSPPRGPAFNTFPRSPVQQQPPPPQPTGAMQQDVQSPGGFPAPTAPAGVSTPGMVVPSPQQPGQPTPFGQPPNPGTVR